MSIIRERTTDTARTSQQPADIRAVAYYRHSAHEGQEDSIAFQRQQIHAWAEKNGVEIIQGFADYGELGLDPDNRPAFRDLMRWVANCTAFVYVLCLDATRWGRFRDSDRSAELTAMCEKYGKRVIYTDDGLVVNEPQVPQPE